MDSRPQSGDRLETRVAREVGPRATRDKHERDVARLLALVSDPMTERAVLTRQERGYLRALASLTDPSHRAWRAIQGAQDGRTALKVLVDGDA